MHLYVMKLTHTVLHFKTIFHTLDTPGSTVLPYMCRIPMISKVLRNITSALGCLYCLSPS